MSAATLWTAVGSWSAFHLADSIWLTKYGSYFFWIGEELVFEVLTGSMGYTERVYLDKHLRQNWYFTGELNSNKVKLYLPDSSQSPQNKPYCVEDHNTSYIYKQLKENVSFAEGMSAGLIDITFEGYPGTVIAMYQFGPDGDYQLHFEDGNLRHTEETHPLTVTYNSEAIWNEVQAERAAKIEAERQDAIKIAKEQLERHGFHVVDMRGTADESHIKCQDCDGSGTIVGKFYMPCAAYGNTGLDYRAMYEAMKQRAEKAEVVLKEYESLDLFVMAEVTLGNIDSKPGQHVADIAKSFIRKELAYRRLADELGEGKLDDAK